MRNNNQLFPSKEELIEDFSWYMQKNREGFTPESFLLKNEYGKKILPAYYDTHVNNWNKYVVVEKAIRNVSLGNIPLNGKIDKIEFTGKLVDVVDYKTGKYENARKKLNQPNEKDPNGGDYWRQAVFYKILMDNDATNDWQTISTLFEFIEPIDDVYKTEKVIVTPQDITTVTQQIKDSWQKIQNKEFKIGCGKPECEWCNFVKTNNITVALHELIEEEEAE